MLESTFNQNNFKTILFKYSSLLPITVIYIIVFLSLSNMQAFVVSNDLLLSAGHVGKILAAAGAAQLWAMIIFIVPMAILSDFLGRPVMIAVTFVGYALYAVALPHVTNVNYYMGMRIAFGVVTASYAASSVALMIDKSDSFNRVSALSIFLAVQGVLGALVLNFINNLPLLFTDIGFNRSNALSASCILISILCIFIAVYTISYLNVESGPNAQQSKLRFSLVKPLQFAISEIRSLIAKIGKARTCALFLTGSLQKSDHFIFQTFVAAWFVSYGKMLGGNSLNAISSSGIVLVTLLLFSAVGPLIAGLFLSSFDKLKGIIIFSSVSAACILAVGISHVPHIPILILDAAILGTSESIVTVLTQAMIGDMTEYSNRATFGGMYTFIGNVVLSFALIVAGFLFDAEGPRFAFLIIGTINFAAIVSILLLFSIGKLWTDRPAPCSDL